MKKISQYFHDLFYSTFKTKELFKFAFYSCLTPLILLLFITGFMTVPAIISYNSVSIDNITTQNLYIDKVMSYALDQDIKCKINDNKLLCDENYSYETMYEFQNNNNDTIKYKIYVNTDVSGIDFSTGKFGEHFDTDNYLILFESYFVFRYTYHNPQDEKVYQYQNYAFYDNLNGTDFSAIKVEADSSSNKDDFLLSKSKSILLDGYKSVAKEKVLTQIVADVGIYLVFMLIVALLIKGNYMLKRNKGFKYTQALKISIVSSLQSTFIAFLASLLLGFSFANILGLAITVRVLYIYCRYTGSRKNTEWLKELYNESKDERFNVA